MSDLMLASTLRSTDLSALLRAWKVPPASAGEPTVMLLERTPRYKVESSERAGLLRFEFFQPDLDISLYHSGRVFHEYGELRWEEGGSGELQVVYTGTSCYQPALPDSQMHEFDEALYKKGQDAYFLFGKRLAEEDHRRIPAAQEGDFAEVRIPRLLRYPCLPALEKAERLQIALYSYLEIATGITLAYRFRSLVCLQVHEQHVKQEGR